jgi:hypothetical protein
MRQRIDWYWKKYGNRQDVFGRLPLKKTFSPVHVENCTMPSGKSPPILMKHCTIRFATYNRSLLNVIVVYDFYQRTPRTKVYLWLLINKRSMLQVLIRNAIKRRSLALNTCINPQCAHDYCSWPIFRTSTIINLSVCLQTQLKKMIASTVQFCSSY